MIALVLLVLLLAVACLAAWLAVSRGALVVRQHELGIRLEELAQERDRLDAEVTALRALDTQRVAGEAVLEERTDELERLRAEVQRERKSASDGVQRLDALTEGLKRLEVTARGAAAKSEAAQAGAERVEGHLLGFTKRIANPQSRGAFGEEALRNQLELLGLRENRDFRRQVKVTGRCAVSQSASTRSSLSTLISTASAARWRPATIRGLRDTPASSWHAPRSSPQRSTGRIWSAAPRSC
jgi:hypothetical protein